VTASSPANAPVWPSSQPGAHGSDTVREQGPHAARDVTVDGTERSDPEEPTMNTRRTRSTLRLGLALGITTLLAGLIACGPTPTTGTLQVVVAGLPAGTDADVTIGTQTITATASLTLAPGAHEITAKSVIATASIMGDGYAPDETQVDTTVTAGQTTTVTITYAVTQEALLLAPNYGDGTITVLTSDDLVAAGEASSAWTTDAYGNGYTGMALGPDGRLYVSDYSNDQIVVIDAGDLASNGDVTPAAVITNAGLIGPMGGGFDSDGNLWVASYSDDVLMRFDDVLGTTGSVDLAPALVVSVDDTTFASAFSSMYDVFVDHLDHVWVADYGSEAVYRFDGLAGLDGTQSVVPDLFLTYTSSTLSDSGYTLYYPISLVVDLDGTLYVGNYDYEVSRFDDALALSGFQDVEASAYLDTGIDYTYMVALDQTGALWVGHYTGELVRLPDPGSYTGYADVSSDLDLELTWFTSAGTGSPDGGTLTFVPTQGRHAGY
jgi:sugar lactone lactonase YvrE